MSHKQKSWKCKIKTGVKVLQNKVSKLQEELDHQEEIIRLNKHLCETHELANARCIVAEQQIVLLTEMINQLLSCVVTLENSTDENNDLTRLTH